MSTTKSWGSLPAAVAALSVCAIALAFPALAEDGKPETAAPTTYSLPQASRHFEFTYKAEIPELPKDAKRVDVWIPIPQSNENQTIGKVSMTPEGTVETEPKTGNRFVHFAVDAPFPPSWKFEMTVDATRREYLRKDFRAKGAKPLSDEEKKALAAFLGADKLVPIDGKIGELSKQVGGDERNIVNLGRKYYDHVLGLMKYSKEGQGWGRGDAVWACDSKFGNCTDFHAVFIGMSRAAGIPARFAMGFSIPEARGAGAVGGYHCWAEFFVPGYGWVPVDISEADKHPELAEYYFGAHTEDRVEFTRGRDLALVPPQKGEPLNFFVYPYAEADGKKWDGVKRSFSYRDVP